MNCEDTSGGRSSTEGERLTPREKKIRDAAILYARAGLVILPMKGGILPVHPKSASNDIETAMWRWSGPYCGCDIWLRLGKQGNGREIFTIDISTARHSTLMRSSLAGLPRRHLQMRTKSGSFVLLGWPDGTAVLTGPRQLPHGGQGYAFAHGIIPLPPTQGTWVKPRRADDIAQAFADIEDAPEEWIARDNAEALHGDCLTSIPPRGQCWLVRQSDLPALALRKNVLPESWKLPPRHNAVRWQPKP